MTGEEAVPLLVVTATVVFAWAVFSARFARAYLTGPMVFMLFGAVMTGWGLVDGRADASPLKVFLEVTLVWVLFSDASGIRLAEFRSDLGRYLRLLAIGLPLTVLAGWGLALGLLGGLGSWAALVVAAALAPTDAALGQPVVGNPVVPRVVRRLITVESGLNDGIVTPVVLLAIAGAAAAERQSGGVAMAAGLLQLAVGVAIGTGVGGAGGALLRWSRQRGWATDAFAGVGVLALALVAYGAALLAGANGFVAAFCGGLAFGATAGPRGPAELVFLEQASGLVSLLVWLAFGAVALPVLRSHVDVATVAYALLSLTVVRMLPVGVALLRSGLDRPTVAFIGWFGPRGLASLVFALLAAEELGAGADGIVAVTAVTVVLSVLVHGVTATPLAHRFGRSASGRRLAAAELPAPVEERRPGHPVPTAGPERQGRDQS